MTGPTTLPRTWTLTELLKVQSGEHWASLAAVSDAQPFPFEPTEVIELDPLLDLTAGFLAAAKPYLENAAPHEQLFSGEDLRNYEALSAACNRVEALLRAHGRLEGEGQAVRPGSWQHPPSSP